MSRFTRYNVYLDWGTGWVAMHDYSGRDLVRQDSFSKDVTLHKDLEPVQDKASFTLDFVTAIANTLLTLDYDQIIKVDIDEVDTDGNVTDWFFGYVRPVTQYDIDIDDRVIQIEALDNSWRLLRKPSARAEYSNQRLDFVVNKILELAGYNSTERGGIPSLSNNVSLIGWQEYDEAWEDTLTELLYAYGYLYYFDEAGVFQVYAWITDSITVDGAFNDNNVIGQLRVDRDDERVGIKFTPGAPTEEIRITQYESRTVSGVELLSRSLDINASPSTVLPDDTLHNYDASITELEESLGGTNLRIVDILNARVESTWQVIRVLGPQINFFGESYEHSGTDSILTTFSISNSNYESEIQFTAPAEVYGSTYNAAVNLSYDLIADLKVRFESGVVTFEVPQGLDDKIDNPYIDFGTQQAQRIGTALTDRASTAIYRYRGRSDSFFEVGQYVQVQSTDLNIDTVGRVVNRRHSYENGLIFYEYELEGAKAIGTLIGTVTAINGTQITTSAGTSSATRRVNEGINPDGSLSQPIVGSGIQDTQTIDGTVYEFSPGENGLLFNSTSLGFYDFDNNSWPVRLQNDGGVGKAYFGNGSDRYMEWNGTDLTITGAANIGGTITAGDGIQSADYFEGTSGWRIDGDGTAEFDAATIRGTIEATTGAIGGWDVTANTIESNDDTVFIRSNSKRFEVQDSGGVVKTALGYLGGIDGNTSDDFGLFIGDGNTVSFSSGATFDEGSYFINSDAAYLVNDGLGEERLRLGSLGLGDVGIDIGGMRFEQTVTGGGGATGTFEATVTGGGGATGTFEAVLTGGGNARYGTDSGLLFSVNENTLFLSGTLVGVDGEFSGTVSAGTIVGGTISGTDIDGVNITGTTISGGTITGAEITGTSGAVVVGDGGAIQSDNYVSGTSGWRIDDTGVEIDDGTFRGNIGGGTIDIGSGNFTVNASGALDALDATIRNKVIIESDNTTNMITIEDDSTLGLVFRTNDNGDSGYSIPVRVNGNGGGDSYTGWIMINRL